MITTLDSIAAPISMIQFPTVTICQDEYRPPDNWAFLETILNNVAFECGNDECKETFKIRKDFDNLIKSVVNSLKGWLMNPTYKTTPVYDVLVNRPWESDPKLSTIITYYENQILGLMENGKISKNAIFQLISTKKFAKTNSIQSELESLSEDIDYYNYNSPVPPTIDTFHCNTSKCEENAKLLDQAIRFLLVVMNIEPKQPFSSFLTSFAHISDAFLCFKPKKHVSLSKSDIYKLKDFFSFIEPDCKNIKGKKLDMHGYFEQLSKIVGFSENELVSLYDLPAIVSNLNLSNILAPSFSQFFLYSRCRGLSDWKPDEIKRRMQECLDSWKGFSVNTSGTVL